jgi:lysophospholipase L1-like esterase
MKGRRRFVQIVLFGDSISWSATSPFGRRYGDCIERELQARLGDGAMVDVAVCGDGGDTAGQALLRLERDCLAYEPDAVLVHLGANNTRREKSHAEPDLRSVVDGIRKRRPRARVVLENVPTVIERLHAYRDHPDIVKAGGLMRIIRTRLNPMVRRVAGAYALPVHDRFAIFQSALARDRSLEGRLIRPDGIHLTEEGNRYFARSAARILADALADALAVAPTDTSAGAPRSGPTAAMLLERAESNPALRECRRALAEGGLELFLRGAGSWARLMLQQARSAARRAECLAGGDRMRARAERLSAMAAAFAALQHALPGEAHARVPADRIESLRWALTRLRSAGDDPEARALARHLRRRAGRGLQAAGPGRALRPALRIRKASARHARASRAVRARGSLGESEARRPPT